MEAKLFYLELVASVKPFPLSLAPSVYDVNIVQKWTYSHLLLSQQNILENLNGKNTMKYLINLYNQLIFSVHNTHLNNISINLWILYIHKKEINVTHEKFSTFNWSLKRSKYDLLYLLSSTATINTYDFIICVFIDTQFSFYLTQF